MPEKSPCYLWYPKDVLSSGRVAALTAAEELWYRRALDHCWLNDGLPSDPVEFAGWVGRGCTPEAAENIINRFFIPCRRNDQKVRNERQESERKKKNKNSRERSKAGIESGRKRRALKGLGDEHLFNENGTKTNLPIPISIPISKKEVTDEKQSVTSDEKKPRKRKNNDPVTVEGIIAECEKRSVFNRLNIPDQWQLAELWCVANRRKCTFRFFVGTWLANALAKLPAERAEPQKPQRDITKCPDCKGRNFVPVGNGRDHKPCTHPNLPKEK